MNSHPAFATLRAPPPPTGPERAAAVAQGVDALRLLSGFATFPADLGGMLREHYPTEERSLLDLVLPSFMLHVPEAMDAVIATLTEHCLAPGAKYSKRAAPFYALGGLFGGGVGGGEAAGEHAALVAGRVLRVLTVLLARRLGGGGGKEDPLACWLADLLLGAPALAGAHFAACVAAAAGRAGGRAVAELGAAEGGGEGLAAALAAACAVERETHGTGALERHARRALDDLGAAGPGGEGGDAMDVDGEGGAGLAAFVRCFAPPAPA